MKKYIIPKINVIEIKAQTILAASTDGGGFDPTETNKMEGKQQSMTPDFQF